MARVIWRRETDHAKVNAFWGDITSSLLVIPHTTGRGIIDEASNVEDIDKPKIDLLSSKRSQYHTFMPENGLFQQPQENHQSAPKKEKQER